MTDDEMQDSTVVICVSYFSPTFFILFLQNLCSNKRPEDRYVNENENGAASLLLVASL